MRPLLAALVVIALAALVSLAVRSGGSSGEPRTPETFQRVIVKPLETTIELTR
jgi:hypothetical protein